ncbi:hypothetical protein ACQPW3_25500 [Actinosynnema sp. CA-248983]
MSADRRSGTVSVDHLSFNSWFEGVVSTTTNVLGKFFGTRANAPQCDGAKPDWLVEVIFLDDINGPLRVCAGSDPKDPEENRRSLPRDDRIRLPGTRLRRTAGAGCA